MTTKTIEIQRPEPTPDAVLVRTFYRDGRAPSERYYYPASVSAIEREDADAEALRAADDSNAYYTDQLADR